MSDRHATEAWVDVGGTFTDCFVRFSDGSLRRAKTLSSGRIPISLGFDDPATAHAIELVADVDGFWNGSDLAVLNQAGETVLTTKVKESRGGTLRLAEPIDTALQSHHRFELITEFEAPVVGVRRLVGCPLQVELPELSVRLGTTKGTNALLTRRGAKTALITTEPFSDLLEIGDQTRLDLFDLAARKHAPLAQHVVTVLERLAPSGVVELPLDQARTRLALEQLKTDGFESIAICLLHGYLNPTHEQLVESIARDVGFQHVSRSSHLAPLIEIVARSQTAVVNAYLGPIVSSYLETLAEQFSAPQLEQSSKSSSPMQVMTSAGGLVRWNEYNGKESILSGPAGGVAALQAFCVSLGFPSIIGLDMGGTSTDVCVASEQQALQYESDKAGVRIFTPTLPIETVASGGGSICWFDGVSLRVGPQSAGASPGPACYGRGGPLTITDLNVYLGRVPSNQFPFPVDMDAIELRLKELLDQVAKSTDIRTSKQLAEGFRRIANEQMAEAVRTVSVSRGIDPRQLPLAGFGGAAGQHVCEIAEQLGVNTLVDTAEAGMLSALGMGLAKMRRDATLPIYESLDSVRWKRFAETIEREMARLATSLHDHSTASDAAMVDIRLLVELRYAGSESTIALELSQDLTKVDSAEIAARFAESHHERFGFRRDECSIEAVAFRIEAHLPSMHRLPPESRSKLPSRRLEPQNGSTYPSIARSEFAAGDEVMGPCIILNVGSTLVVESGWTATCLPSGTLLLSRSDRVNSGKRSDKQDAVFRDCFAARLSAIATQMGLVLQQTAVSVNVKQRRDFSCAVFDASGNLLANAPHVPVHLGAMGETVRAMLDQFPDLKPGDTFISNDPYTGGSHLPDITVVTPVFEPDSKRLAMFVANRAHHSDVGGVSPGSMSVKATCLGQEGVIIPPTRLFQEGESHFGALENRFRTSPYPPRAIEENISDIAAQCAANHRGEKFLQDYAQSETWSKLRTSAEQLLDAAQRRTEHFLSEFDFQEGKFTDQLQDGTPIQVNLRNDGSKLHVDFEGTGAENRSNFNANPSIVQAAVMYVLRCLIADELPLNEGVLRCVRLNIPRGVLNPRVHLDRQESPAVAAGNVETSQRVVDVLFGALGMAAASQGTMNNLLFGNREFGFYETICGGAGATQQFRGTSAVHTHMTNTRLTDPEVLESRYPVRLRQFQIRRGSGGGGTQAGGDGVIREIEFREPVTLSLLTSRRGSDRPFGVCGGEPGQSGRNRLQRVGSRETVELDACCELDLHAGDRLTIETPGGGGFGNQPNSSNS